MDWISVNPTITVKIVSVSEVVFNIGVRKTDIGASKDPVLPVLVEA